MKSIGVLLSILLISCAHGQITENKYDGGVDVDSSVCHPPPGVLDDWCTSGDSNTPCNPLYSDRTKNNHCVCGMYASCSDGFNCRFGTCIEADLNGEVCEFDSYQTDDETGGDCSRGYLCIEGHCTFRLCVPEECDSVDNDCDGMIDEAEDTMPLRELCLGEQPIPEIVNLPCTVGRRECINGVWSECNGEVLPQTEQGLLACNSIDDDCDGCIDGVLQQNGTCSSHEPGNFDVVFIMDISGSMNTTILDVRTAVNNFVANFSNNPTFRFAIILIGEAQTVGGQGTLYLDLTDFNTFIASLALMPVSGGGEEPQWDTIYELGSGELQLDWLPGAARILILFSDENGQTTRNQRGLPSKTEADACASLQHGEVWASFTLPAHQTDFDDCGLRFDISDSATMENILENDILVDPCQ